LAAAVATTDARPALAITDLDDGGKNVAGVRAILRAGWASRTRSSCSVIAATWPRPRPS
jgi:hypothetical protein